MFGKVLTFLSSSLNSEDVNCAGEACEGRVRVPLGLLAEAGGPRRPRSSVRGRGVRNIRSGSVAPGELSVQLRSGRWFRVPVSAALGSAAPEAPCFLASTLCREGEFRSVGRCCQLEVVCSSPSPSEKSVPPAAGSTGRCSGACPRQHSTRRALRSPRGRLWAGGR